LQKAEGFIPLKNLFEQIITYRDNFTKQQTIFADYVLKHSKEIAFLPIAQVSKQSLVSSATIVRFCRLLGFKGYTEFAKLIQQSLQSDLTAFNRYKLKKFMGNDQEEDPQPKSIYHKLLQQEISNTANLFESIDKKNYVQCLDLMVAADRFCVIGSLASSALAVYLGQNLSKINYKTDIIQHSGIPSFAALEKLTKDSVVFLLSFPRYPQETLELGRFARTKGAHIISITDTPMSPLVSLADISLYIPVNLLPFGESYTAPIAFITVLCSEFSDRLPDRVLENLQQYDDYTSDLQCFEKSPKK